MKTSLFAAAFVVLSALPAAASAFWPGTVINIPSWDSLNVRAWPSSMSRVIDVYDAGEHISMTGRCKNVANGLSFRIDAGGSAKWKYSRMSAPNVWCQVMTPQAQIGWVRGRFVWPQ
jgi:hypothetical protein